MSPRLRRLLAALVLVVLAAALAAVASGAVLGGDPESAPDPADRAADVPEQHVLIPAGDHQIPATLTLPTGGGAAPAALLVHGFASTKDEVGNMYARLAQALAKRGVASLRFDFPGSGDSTQPFTTNTVAYQIAETRRALAYLAGQSVVDAERLALVGFSLGGIDAVPVAAGDPRVKALALWSTPGDTPASFQDLYDAYYDEAVQNGSVTVDLGFRTVELSKAFFDSLFASYPLQEIRGYANPLLTIAGAEDAPQPTYARQLVLNAGSLDATLRIVPGADHIYDVLTKDQTKANLVIRLTARWLDQKLG